MRIQLAPYGTHGCPREIGVVRAPGGQLFIATSNEACGTCDREGTTLWIGAAIEANRKAIDAMPVSKTLLDINYD